MNYYICVRCGSLYCGWAISEICQKCGRGLKSITREEFYSKEKGVVIEESKK
ncbi:hypothetical protein ES705_33489 [subsurface metagenome]